MFKGKIKLPTRKKDIIGEFLTGLFILFTALLISVSSISAPETNNDTSHNDEVRYAACLNDGGHFGNYYGRCEPDENHVGNAPYCICCECGYVTYPTFDPVEKIFNYDGGTWQCLESINGQNPLYKTKFNKTNFLYRIGNGNNFKASDIFYQATDINLQFKSIVGNVTLTNPNPGEYRFANTGIVLLMGGSSFDTIQGPVTKFAQGDGVWVEVINGVNITAIDSTTNSYKTTKVAVLCDITASAVLTLEASEIYGNDFSIIWENDIHTTSRTAWVTAGYIILRGSKMENLRVYCPIFPYAYLYSEDYQNHAIDLDPTKEPKDKKYEYPYFRNAVTADKSSTIKNSYVYGGRSCLFIFAGLNTIIENCTFEKGTFACIEMVGSSYTYTLRNVTTIQRSENDAVTGFGIVIKQSAANLLIDGYLKQYNWVTRTEALNTIYARSSGGIGESLATATFGQAKYLHSYNDKTYVNLGIVFAVESNDDQIIDLRPDKGGYIKSDISAGSSISKISGSVYSISSDIPLTDENYIPGEFSPSLYDVIEPTYTFSNKNSDASFSKTNWALSFETNKGSIEADLSGFSPTQYGKTLNYLIICSEAVIIDQTTKKITLSTDLNTYTIIFEINVDNKGYDFSGSKISGITTFHKTLTINISKIGFPAPEWNMCSPDPSACFWTKKYDWDGGDYSEVFPLYNGIKVKYYTKDGEEKIVDFTTNTTIPTLSSSNSATLTLDDGSVLTIKANYSTAYEFLVANNKSKIKTVFVYLAKPGNDKKDVSMKFTYSFKDPNGQFTSSDYVFTYSLSKEDSRKEIDFDKLKAGQYAEYSTGGCFADDTLITLADGTKKAISEVTTEDKIISYNFFTGEFDESSTVVLVDHGEDDYLVTKLSFSNGNELKIIADHGLFDYDLNKFIFISSDNCNEYLGHRFVSFTSDGTYELVELESFTSYIETTHAYSITSSNNFDAIAQDMLTMAPPEGFYNWIQMGDSMRYDIEQFNKDVETYGLYTYDDFKDYITYDQFVNFNGAYLKIAVEKGYFTFDYILELINTYGQWMPTTNN